MSEVELQPSVLVRQRCTAHVDGRQCENKTRRGYLCADHAEELLGLRVLTSGLGEPGDAGLGLFTSRPRARYEKIDEYSGDLVSRSEFDAHPSAYGISVSQGRVINAVRSNSCFARYANDRRDRFNNCMLVSDRQYGLQYARPRYKSGSGAKVWLVAKRKIDANEELFADYGSQYFSDES